MKYIMNEEALIKSALIRGAIEGRYSVGEVARRLKLSPRRVKQLKKAFKEQGESACIHGNRGRHPANHTHEELRKKIISLKQSDAYSDTNFTHFRELLSEREGIHLSYSAVYGILKREGIASKRKHKAKGRRFKRRARRSACGELLQGDASAYPWFGDGVYYSLHGFIDDATGKITGLYFCEHECIMGYLEVLRQTLTAYGVPLELYTDKAGIFSVNNKKKGMFETIGGGEASGKTRFTDLVERLGISVISAHTPQAKGRIERLWGTLQDRLPVWLSLNGISDKDKANRLIHMFIEDFNQRFAVEPEKAEGAFRPLAPSEDLESLLTVRHERVTDNCGCFSFQNFIFQIEGKTAIAKKKIVFMFSEKMGFSALYDGTYHKVSCLGLNKDRKISHIPNALKHLIHRTYYAEQNACPT